MLLTTSLPILLGVHSQASMVHMGDATGESMGHRLVVSDVADGIVRVWDSRGAARRAPSLALGAAKVRPRRPSKLGQSFVCGALRVVVDSTSHRVAVETDGKQRIAEFGFALDPGGTWKWNARVSPEEHLLGLGEDNRNRGQLDRRRTIRELWAGQQIRSGDVTADYPVPLLVSTGPKGHCYGLFFDNTHRLKFDLAKTKKNEVRLEAAGGEAGLYFIDGPTLKDVVKRYTLLTGRPSLPPLWALGYWQSKCAYWEWTDLDATYEALHAKGFPVDVMVIDSNWSQFNNNFVWADRWAKADPAKKIADYRQRGVKIVTSQSGPMLKNDSPTWPSAKANGLLATDGKGNPEQAGYYGGDLLDYTAPGIKPWLFPQLAKRNHDGVAGWWLDLTEPEGEPPQTVYFGGKSADIHNQFSMISASLFEESLLRERPDTRPFILTRCGSAGIQRHHTAVWTGDIYSDYATLRAHPGEMLNSGLSGLTWWTNDSGGFMNGFYKDDQFGAHARLYERWMQFSVFSPITRAHKSGPSAPYDHGLATEQGTLKYLKLRYRLLPYIYSYAWEASQTGVPLVRPMMMEFPSMGPVGDQYMFGENLLVAPVLYEGLTNRIVAVPPGKWVDWETGLEYEGGRSWVVAAPQNRIPVLVRPGAIIPLAPDMQSTREKPWDPLTVEVYPHGTSSFRMVRDDGETFGYRRGEFTLTSFVSKATARSVEFSISESNKKFVPHVYKVQLHLDRTPLRVDVEGDHQPKWRWNADDRVLSVPVVNGKSARHRFVVKLSTKRLSGRPAPLLKAEVLDANGEAAGGGQPTPHFFPGPEVPNRFKAANYDNGGEGMAFHRSAPVIKASPYRADDAGLVEGDDEGGGYVLEAKSIHDWFRYTVNAENGGYFDFAARVKSSSGGRFHLMESDRTIATIEVPAGGWHEVAVPNVYLNPGSPSLMLVVDKPGFRLNALEFRAAANPPSLYEAEAGLRAGGTGISGPDPWALKDLGRTEGSVTYGVLAPSDGAFRLRFRYRNGSPRAVRIEMKVGAGAAQEVAFPVTGNDWKTIDVPVGFSRGGNRVWLHGLETDWVSIQLDSLEIVGPVRSTGMRAAPMRS